MGFLRKAYWWTGLDLFKLYNAFRDVRRRWHRPFDKLNIRGVGAEIGVFRGVHARDLLKLNPAIETLWLVDPYEDYPRAMPQMEHAENAAHHLLRHCADKVKWLKASSTGCVDRLPELDFVYIDGAHDYESVREDIRTIWPKMKQGAIVGGHDFRAHDPGVIRAVSEFACANGLELYAQSPDWWFVKT